MYAIERMGWDGMAMAGVGVGVFAWFGLVWFDTGRMLFLQRFCSVLYCLVLTI